MSQTHETRRGWMSALAKAPAARLAALFPDLPRHELLRAPEIGAVMVEGRIGGTGGRFNLGEMTVTRCSVRLGQAVGHACVQGRDKDHARRAAVVLTATARRARARPCGPGRRPRRGRPRPCRRRSARWRRR